MRTAASQVCANVGDGTQVGTWERVSISHTRYRAHQDPSASANALGGGEPLDIGDASAPMLAPMLAPMPGKASVALPVILIADDEAPIREAIALILEENGYQSMMAFNGWEALQTAQACWPALVITDWMMPRMDGLELVVALRTLAIATSRQMPPVALMTAAVLDGRRRQDLDASGVDVVVSKPFEVTNLEAIIVRLLLMSSSA